MLLGLFVMSACSGSSSAAQATPTSLPTATATLGGPTTTKSSLLYPSHYQYQRVLTLTGIADQMIAGMSLDEELGQLFIAQLNGTTLTPDDLKMVQSTHAGGIILYSDSIKTTSQTKAMIAAAQKHAKIPLIVAIDEEGGYVDRLTNIYGFRPTATQIGDKDSTSYARQQGVQVGKDMLALGFNLDFAPDVDVQLQAGPDQITRTFGTDPDTVTRIAGAWLEGLQSTGAVGTLKHFPGLGDADHDAHLRLPVIKRTRDQIESVELAPYRALINSGQAQVVMPTDLLMPALDPDLPAELSPAIITGVLRKELHFDGVIITDALYMDGIAAKWSMPQAGVMAIQAGDDMLLGAAHSGTISSMISALKAAINNHTLSKSRIDDSVRRILLLKINMGIIPLPTWAVQAQLPTQSPTSGTPTSTPVANTPTPKP